MKLSVVRTIMFCYSYINQDMAVLGYNAPSHAADSLSGHFSGDREAAVILDVACGTGNVAKQVKSQQQNRQKTCWLVKSLVKIKCI